MYYLIFRWGGKFVMRLNLYFVGNLPWVNKSCPTYLTLSLRKSHFSSQKITRYLLKLLHTYSRRSMMIWIFPAHIRTSYIINLLSVCNFVSLMRIVSYSMKVMSYPPISVMFLSRSRNT